MCSQKHIVGGQEQGKEGGKERGRKRGEGRQAVRWQMRKTRNRKNDVKVWKKEKENKE